MSNLISKRARIGTVFQCFMLYHIQRSQASAPIRKTERHSVTVTRSRAGILSLSECIALTIANFDEVFSTLPLEAMKEDWLHLLTGHKQKKDRNCHDLGAGAQSLCVWGSNLQVDYPAVVPASGAPFLHLIKG